MVNVGDHPPAGRVGEAYDLVVRVGPKAVFQPEPWTVRRLYCSFNCSKWHHYQAQPRFQSEPGWGSTPFEFSLVWYWTGMRVASTTSHHTTTTRNPTRDSRYSRRLILGVLTSLKTSELVDAEGFLSKHLLSRGHLSPDDGEDPLLQISPWLRSVDKDLALDTLEWLSQNKETFTVFKSFEGNDW